MIWLSLQQAFATSGHLVLARAPNADFFLQAHVRDGSTSEYESDSLTTITDPHMFLDANNSPLAPKDYVNLHAADVYSKRERISFTILVEIWDLRNKNLLLKKEYTIASNFNMFAIASTKESQYIRNEENMELLISTEAKTFAKNVVNDLYSSSDFATKQP
jgi:hypothetical protein